MALTRLRLAQFRCHDHVQLVLGPGRHFFFGDNGRGKTSLLEAVHYLSRLRTWRGGQTRDLVQWGRDAFRIEAEWTPSDQPSVVLEATWRATGREMKVEGQPVNRAAEFWGRMPTVLFVGDDRELVSGPGVNRRVWADALIAQRDPWYLGVAQHYARALKQRNAWLKRGGDPAVGESLRQQVTENGRAMTAARLALSEALAERVAEAYRRVAACGETLTLAYRPSFPADPEATPDWDRVAADEARLQTTAIGPHRDDWAIRREGRPLGTYGSEGQQRSAALALRLVEAELIRERRGYWPVLLMDDVTPQLDANRQRALRDLLPEEAPLLVTAPSDRGWVRPEDTVWQVTADGVTQE